MTDETPRRRRTDRWQQWSAIAFMVVTGLAGLGIVAAWLGWHVVHLMGGHGGADHACGAPIGTWEALYGSTGFLLVASVFAGGSPGKTARNMLDAIVSRVEEGD